MAFKTEKKLVPPWSYVFLTDETVSCLFCQQKDRPQIVRSPEEDVEDPRPPIAGVCEACAVHAYHLWRRSKGDVPPGFDAEAACKVSLVKVFIPKLRLSSKTESGKEFPGLIDSYDILLTKNETVDLPGVEVVGAETEVDAATRALKEVGITTWKQFIEPLWTGFTPRGRLASVMMVTAWTKEGTPSKTINWKKWPVHDHVPEGLKGFYLGLVAAWQLRIFKYQAILPAQRTEEISVYLREGAAKYIGVQRELRLERISLERGFPLEQKERDLSMIEYARKSMSDDERKIEKTIETYELGEAEVAKLEAEKAGEQLGIEGVEKEDRHEGEDSQGASGPHDGGDPRRDFTPGLRASSKVVIEAGGSDDKSSGWDAGILARVRSEVGVEPPSSGEADSSSEDDEGEGEGEDEDEPVGADPGAEGNEDPETPVSGADSGPEPGFARKGRPLTIERK